MIEDKMDRMKVEGLSRQVIVKYDTVGLKKELLMKIARLKYDLPMINAYVIEINEKDMKDLEGLEGIIKIEQDAYLTAQMNRVRQVVHALTYEEKIKDGEGVGVAILDTGLYPHKDLTRKKKQDYYF